jgi:hypothetical protein
LGSGLVSAMGFFALFAFFFSANANSLFYRLSRTNGTVFSYIPAVRVIGPHPRK